MGDDQRTAARQSAPPPPRWIEDAVAHQKKREALAKTGNSIITDIALLHTNLGGNMKALVYLLAFGTLSAPIHAQLPVTTSPNQQALLKGTNRKLAANKKLVFDFWREVFQTHNTSLAPQYLAEDYIQHNPNVATGRQPFMDFFGRFERQPVRPEIDNLVTIVAEGDKVVLAFRRELSDPQSAGKTYTTTWFDMFRIKDGKIAEHWDYGTKPTK